jgi:4a-hydroxytetrahydrobiopterin dehydratase
VVIYNKTSLDEVLKELNQWQLHHDAIERNFVFKNFNEALAFIVQVGLLSEKAGHHAEIWNVYNQVKLRLNTHSEKAITSNDIELAKSIDLL